MRLRDERLRRTPACLDPDLTPPVSDMGADDLIRDFHRLVLIHQPREDPLRRVPLLARRIQIGPQHLVDQWLN
ncbi:hypothetical protein [Nonomuraea sp. NPDC005692]|uniref:hypothetical protein n=1 Tax=Nonomuraea sp. NPDC005692 TaxID=3157168 RepID=UPI0033C4D386